MDPSTAKSMPQLIVIAGPNGAGKSTSAPHVLRRALRVTEFVNADVIARGLSAFDPERAAISAGKIMLTRMHELADSRASFAFETTLASRTFAPWIASLLSQGYHFHLVYFWLPSPEMAIERVEARVRSGGHFVPTATIERRYLGGIRNFFELYQPLATSWRIYNNMDRSGAKLIASGGAERKQRVYRAKEWKIIRQIAESQERGAG